MDADGFMAWFNKKAIIIQTTTIYATVVNSMYQSFKDEGMDHDTALELTKHSISAIASAIPGVSKVVSDFGRQENSDD